MLQAKFSKDVTFPASPSERRNPIGLVLCVTLLALIAPARAEEGAVLSRKGEAVRVIFQGVSELDAGNLGKAFSAVLEKMTGQPPQVESLPADAAPPAGVLVLRQTNEASTPADAFRLRTVDGRVEISAPLPIGLRFGFYELMERLGCRFWSWDEEDIPHLDEVRVGALDIAWNPPFRMHDLMNQEAMTKKNDFVHKLRAVSPREFTGNHNIQPMLRKFAQAHPDEVFPLVKIRDKATGAITGEERKFNNLHYCYTAPGIAAALAAELEKEVAKRKGNVRDFIYFAGMGDWYGGYCECPRCQKIYDEEAWTNADGKVSSGLSATLIRMINEAAAILEEKYPGIQIGTFAYMSLEAPPAKTVPRDNVSIFIPRLRHDAATAANDPKGGNRDFWLNLVRWNEIAPGRVDVWEYGANYANFLLPYPVLDTMARSITAYHEAGIRGLMIQGNYASMGGDAVVLNNWVWSHLMSDPTRKVEDLVREFTNGYYGPAAPEIRAYLGELDALLSAPNRPPFDEFSDALKTYLTPEALKSLEARLTAARKLVSAPEHARYLPRVNDLALGVEAARLWKEGPFREKDGHYIRSDFGYNTFPEALALWKNNRRGATPTELSSGRAKWLEFLALHGGPVTTLRQGDLRVKIWPAKAGSMGPILLGYVPVISRTFDSALRFAEFEGTPTETSARLTGEGGVGSWDPDTKYVVGKSISLPDASTLRVETSDQRVTKSPKWNSAPHVIQTNYPIKAPSKEIQFAYRDKAGAWHEVETLPAKGREIVFPEVTAWRVTQPRAVVTDTFEDIRAIAGTPPINPKRPHLSGRLGADSTGAYYTISNIQVDETSFDAPIHGFTRVLHIEKR